MPAAEREKPTQESFLFSSLILHPLFFEARRNQQWETVDSLQGSRPDVDVKAFSKRKVFFLTKRGTIRPVVDDRPFSKDEVVDLYSSRLFAIGQSWQLENKRRPHFLMDEIIGGIPGFTFVTKMTELTRDLQTSMCLTAWVTGYLRLEANERASRYNK